MSKKKLAVLALAGVAGVGVGMAMNKHSHKKKYVVVTNLDKDLVEEDKDDEIRVACKYIEQYIHEKYGCNIDADELFEEIEYMIDDELI